jgi:hypothetical protein
LANNAFKHAAEEENAQLLAQLIDTEVLALLLDTYTPFEVPAHVIGTDE